MRRRNINGKNRKGKRLKKAGIALLLVIIALLGGFYIYTLDYYRASDRVDSIIDQTEDHIVFDKDKTIVFPKDNDSRKGIVFYPGGKVEARAYMPLMIQLADKGYTSVLVEMPLNLAVFGIKSADKILDSLTGVDEWYLAGHSLGGAMASTYIEKNTDKFEGLILLGAYPVNEAPINTLVIYGTYDVNLDLEKIQKADEVYEILDGNHAYFGNYGEQKGDGQALITREEQQKQAVEAMVDFIK